MSVLSLIRHGQASFMSENYDVLSDLGAHQARLAGEWCAARWPTLDAFYTGPCRRQIDTAKHFVEVP